MFLVSVEKRSCYADFDTGRVKTRGNARHGGKFFHKKIEPQKNSKNKAKSEELNWESESSFESIQFKHNLINNV
jgi:hypothetical protein